MLRKLYTRCLRSAAVTADVAESAGAQFGVVPEGGTHLPAVCTQVFCDGAARRGRTVAALFTDIKGAIYNVLPETALGPLLATAQQLELFGKLGMSEAAAQAFSDSTESGVTALSRHDLAEGWRSALAGWHRGSWFTAFGNDRCTMPLVGVRPGDPPADVVFAIAFTGPQKLLSAELEARRLQPSLEVAGTRIFRTPGAPQRRSPSLR